eukprot:TRINITY_DN2079_c0_g1_i1.p2 TRINITY_DN2079_c0_g1~~TRINITY_DN2079_c0_g1_i1.p2  ORF type:complete len:482 (+),score=84.02 TRINITY_DN2079_c0_g1_i1:93-1448(+)
MGGACTSLTEGKIPNLYLICLQAVEHELLRRQNWLSKKLGEMGALKTAAISKAKECIKAKELMLALASAKAAIMENEKITALAPIKEELAKAVNEVGVEIKQEEQKGMDFNRLKEQMDKKPLIILRELVEKWITKFEDMITNPVTSLNIVEELEKDIHKNPLELFKKLKEIAELGDFDETSIFLAYNPQLYALRVARKLLAEKHEVIAKQIESYKSQKEHCITQAKAAAEEGRYANTLLLIKSIPVFEGKIKAGGLVESGLQEELKEIDQEILTVENAKPTLEELEVLVKEDPTEVTYLVMQKWLKKQEDIAGKLFASAEEMTRTLTAPISMNPLDIIKEINESGVLPNKLELPVTAGMNKVATAVLEQKAPEIMKAVGQKAESEIIQQVQNKGVEAAAKNVAGSLFTNFKLFQRSYPIINACSPILHAKQYLLIQLYLEQQLQQQQSQRK